jgi:hypothetical protein
MHQESILTVAKMGILTIGGWAISMQEMLEVAKLVSIVIPTALSIVVFVRDEKRRNGKDNESEN